MRNIERERVRKRERERERERKVVWMIVLSGTRDDHLARIILRIYGLIGEEPGGMIGSNVAPIK